MTSENGALEKMRIDVWLWATRQLKSRSLATAAARAGHVKINGVNAKAASKVEVGDEVRLRIHGFDRVLEVQELLAKRVGAPAAQKAYRDITPPRLHDPAAAAVIYRPKGSGRPTKKERRQLDSLRGRTAF